jgi:hypothetical protein
MRSWLKRTFQEAAWAPLAVFCFYVVAAKGFNAYILYPWLDMPTHFVGGIAITYFFRVGTAHAQEVVGSIPRSIQLVLSLGLTAVTAVVWEFLEFLSDVTFGTHMNLGVSDTLSDLLFGLLGALVVVVAAALRLTRNQVNSVRVPNEV